MTGDRITLTVVMDGEMVAIPLGPNSCMWMRIGPEQAAEVRAKIAELGPGARFVPEPNPHA